jgi:hypothetical protein
MRKLDVALGWWLCFLSLAGLVYLDVMLGLVCLGWWQPPGAGHLPGPAPVLADTLTGKLDAPEVVARECWPVLGKEPGRLARTWTLLATWAHEAITEAAVWLGNYYLSDAPVWQIALYARAVEPLGVSVVVCPPQQVQAVRQEMDRQDRLWQGMRRALYGPTW